jgi:tetratricopeptide (TPR) repeat protein
VDEHAQPAAPETDVTASFGPSTPVPTGSVRLLVRGAAIGERYTVLSVLGQGGFAVVYRAFDRELRREVALKILRPDRVTENALARFRREAAVARDCQSPRLLRIFDLGSAAGAVYLSMEVVDGGSLRERLDQGPLSIEESLRTAIALFEGLAVLHGLGIVHRDVKPSNLLLDRDGEAKLADFGLARQLDTPETRVTIGERLFGTVDYLAPEQVRGREADERSDLYAGGLVLFEMVTGRPAFRGESALGGLLERLVRDAPDLRRLRPDAPRWLARLVARLLAREPLDRHVSADAVLADLRARRARILPRRRARRRAAATGVLLVLLAVGALVSGDRLRFRSREQAPAVRIVPMEPTGVEARDAQGRHLWALPDVDRDEAQALTLARLEPGGKPLLAGVVCRRGEMGPEATRRLSILDPATGAILRRIPLPDRPAKFAEVSNRYVTRGALLAMDLDGDGVDEIVLTLFHPESAPSYTVLYEPRLDRARIVFVGGGGHRIVGSQDVDGDGRKELLIGGINNAFGWYNVMTAVRLDPPVGALGAESQAASPDLAAYRHELQLLAWYTLLPRGHIDILPSTLRVDPRRRLVSVGAPDGDTAEIGFDGFLTSEPSAQPVAERSAARQAAWAAAFEANRLKDAGFDGKAIAMAEAAVRAAKSADESRLVEFSQRLLGRILIGTGRVAEGLQLLGDLAEHAENASDIAFDTARALHLRGDLDDAARWYERGIGPGGTINSGKGKWGFAEGAVLALGERARWQDALAWIDRFTASYPDFEAWTKVYVEYVRWRSGSPPRLPEVADGPSITAQQRYWRLEFRLANGEEGEALLALVRTEVAEPSEMHGELRSLESVLLDRLGRHEEGLVAARGGFEEIRRRLPESVLARAHFDLAAERLAGLAKGAEGAAALAEVARFRRNGATNRTSLPVSSPDAVR